MRAADTTRIIDVTYNGCEYHATCRRAHRRDESLLAAISFASQEKASFAACHLNINRTSLSPKQQYAANKFRCQRRARATTTLTARRCAERFHDRRPALGSYQSYQRIRAIDTQSIAKVATPRARARFPPRAFRTTSRGI